MYGQSNSNSILSYIKIENEDITVTRNGVYQASDGYTGLGIVTVQTDSVNNQEKSVNPEIFTQILEPDQGYTGFSKVTINPVTSSIDENIQNGNIKSGVTILGVSGNVIELKATPIDIEPKTYLRAITPNSPYNGFSIINAYPVTKDIDQNIQEQNIKSGITILGVTGNYEGASINNQPNKTANPSTSQQIIQPDSGYTGLDQVTITPVTYSIDNNITEHNIKSGVTILGITGDYEGTVINNQNKTVTTNGEVTADHGYTGLGTVTVNVSGSSSKYGININNLLGDIDTNGVLQRANQEQSLTFELPNTATDIGNLALYYKLNTCIDLTSVNLPYITTVSGYYGLSGAFYGCTRLTSVDLSSLVTVSGENAFGGTFNNCSGLTSVNLSSLTTVSGEAAFFDTFANCTNLTTISFPNLQTISGENAFTQTFRNCTNLTSISFLALETISGDMVFYDTFDDCTSLSSAMFFALENISNDFEFPQTFSNCTNLQSIGLTFLKTISGDYAFYRTFEGCSDLTNVLFPSLETISGDNAFYQTFSNCTNLPGIVFPNLNTISGNNAFYQTFSSCQNLTNIYFNALTTNSFSYSNVFEKLLSQTGLQANITIHFPSNLRNTIEGLTGYPQFGSISSSITILFDLDPTS